MHYRFEITLIVNSVLDEAAPLIPSSFARDVMEQHLRRYMVNYYREHAELPTGRHYLGMTRPLNLEVGMINFDAIRSEFRTHRMQERDTARERAGYLREIMKKEKMPKKEVV